MDEKSSNVITGEAIDVVGIVDPELTIRYVNWTVPGLTREGVVGNSVLDLVPPGYRDVARDTYTTVLRTGIGTRFETIYSDAEGFHIFDVRVGPVRVERRNHRAHRDHDQRDRAAPRASRPRSFLLALARHAGRRWVRTVTTGEPTRPSARPSGYEPSELCATPFIDFVHPDDRAETREVFAGLLRGTRVTDFENRYRRKDGEYRVFSWRATLDPITGDVYGVARDITAHRATEAQLHQAQKMEAIGQLAGGVAHDFNNLLLAILANAELAMATVPQGSETAECLSEIEAAGRRAADLTNQLLAFSRRQPSRPIAVDLNELIRGLMKMLRRLLPESISIELLPGRNLAAVSADPTQLEQVIVNLCVNARDAMERGGQLTLETETIAIDTGYCETHPWAKPGRYVLLRVTDTGVGMSGEVRERAFEPFFTTKGAHRGTGLGLSTVYGIVQQHGGMVHVSSEVGEGTTFKVYLPADSRRVTDAGRRASNRWRLEDARRFCSRRTRNGCGGCWFKSSSARAIAPSRQPTGSRPFDSFASSRSPCTSYSSTWSCQGSADRRPGSRCAACAAAFACSSRAATRTTDSSRVCPRTPKFWENRTVRKNS